MHWLTSFFRSPYPVSAVADVPAATAPRAEMPETLSTFTRPVEQQANFRKVIDGFSHALAAMGLPEGKNHHVGVFELLRYGKTGVHLTALRPMKTLEGTEFKFFEQSGDVASELEQLTAWTMKEMGVQAFIEKNLDELFANGRRPFVEIWYNEARDPVDQTFLHKDDAGEAIFACLHYDTDRDTDGVEFTVNDASVAMVLDQNPRNLPASIIAKLRTAHQTLPPADKIYESMIDPEGGVFFNNVLLSHSSPGPMSRGIEPSLLKKRLPGFFERQGPNSKQAYDTCMRLRQARLTGGLSPAERRFLLNSPVNLVIDVVELAIFDGVKKLYIQAFAQAGLQDALARSLLEDAGIESLDTVQLREKKVPTGDRMKTLPRERSVTLAQRGEQPHGEVPKRPSFLAMEFML